MPVDLNSGGLKLFFGDNWWKSLCVGMDGSLAGDMKLYCTYRPLSRLLRHISEQGSGNGLRHEEM